MRQIRALVWKDLHVHWRVAGPLLLGWPLGVRVLLFVHQASPDTGRIAAPAVVTTISSLLFVAVSAGVATLLVERERSKDTFAWLRTLPMSDAHIVAGKCATWLVLHSAGAVAWWMALGQVGRGLTVPQVISVWCATAVIGSLALVSQMASSGRLAQGAPVAVVALGLMAGPTLRLWPSGATRVLEAWRGSWQHVLFWFACLAVYTMLVAVAYWGFHADETHVLTD